MTDDVLIKETTGAGVCTLTLNRPAALNAFNGALTEALGGALDDLARDTDVRAVVLRGAGRAFSAGVDLKHADEPPLSSPAAWREHLTSQVELVFKLWDLPQPIVAAVHGHCLGLACDLAVAADLVICDETARLGEPEIRYSSASTFLILPYILGLRGTKDLLLTGDTVDAREAHRLGLVSRVVPAGTLGDEAAEAARRLAELPQEAVRLNKAGINMAFEMMGLRQAVRYNVETFVQMRLSEDAQAFDRLVADKGLKAAVAERSGSAAVPR